MHTNTIYAQTMQRLSTVVEYPLGFEFFQPKACIDAISPKDNEKDFLIIHDLDREILSFLTLFSKSVLKSGNPSTRYGFLPWENENFREILLLFIRFDECNDLRPILVTFSSILLIF